MIYIQQVVRVGSVVASLRANGGDGGSGVEIVQNGSGRISLKHWRNSHFPE